MRLGAFGLLVAFAVLLVVTPAFAAESAGAVQATGGLQLNALALAIAAFGGALGQGKIISSAVDAIARNPGASGAMFLPWLLGIVFIETLVIYVLLIAAGIL